MAESSQVKFKNFLAEVNLGYYIPDLVCFSQDGINQNLEDTLNVFNHHPTLLEFDEGSHKCINFPGFFF